jgi:hypothetical protein
MRIVFSPIGWLLLLLTLGIRAEAQLINGNFETGDFTGWTLYNEEHGTLGVTNIVVFETITGTPSQCAEFEVGKSEIINGVVTGYGGGIKQEVVLNAGQLTISANIAAYHDNPVYNADGGNFVLFLDGAIIATNYFGKILAYQTMRSTLNYSGLVTSGAHEIAIAIRRPWLSTPSVPTPYQFVDNVMLTVSEISPIPLNIRRNGSTVVLTWTNAIFSLQAAPSPTGIYTNVPGAISPYTNNISSAVTFFRLVAD